MFGPYRRRKPKHPGRRFLGWHPETLVCSRRGHVTPAAKVARLRPEDAGLGVDLPDGRRMVRCTRCDVWLAIARPTDPEFETLPPLEDLEMPRRGRELKDAIVLRLISLDRVVHSVLFGLLAVGLILLDLNLGGLKADAQRIVDALSRAAGQTGQGNSQSVIVRELHKLLGVHKGTLTVLAATAAAYCIVEGVEAVGLWLERRWAEYLTAVATAGFLPFEIHELTVRVTAFRIGALIVNLAILFWLVWRKRLFGVNGGAKAATVERPDPVALFAPPALALEP